MTERTDPQMCADEVTTLVEFLDWYRATLLIKVEGLRDDQARRAVAPPSGLNLLGLVRHLAEVERSWFQRVMEGHDAPPLFYTEQDPDGDLFPGPAATLEEATTALRAEIAEARRITAAHALDDVAASLRHGNQVSLRWILVHMIEEYARHCGHADLLREMTDGAVGD